MKYLKLYEDFGKGEIKISDLLEDIASLDYILSDEGIEAKYYVTEKYAHGSTNRYMIGTSENIASKTGSSFDGVGIYKIQVYYDVELDMKSLRRRHDPLGNEIKNDGAKESDEIMQISEEYFNQLKGHLEEVYDVHVVKDKPHTTGRIKRDGDYGLVQVNCVSVIVERQPDDYVYFDEEEITESVDDETAMKHYGMYPEDVSDIFYDLQDPDLFPERLAFQVQFKSMLGQNGNLMFNDPMTPKKLTFQHFPFIEVRVKKDLEKAYGFTQADRNRMHRELTDLQATDRFKEFVETANARLGDEGWTIEKTHKDFGNDYLSIILKKI
jgi:hypothetical protein